MQYYKVSKNGRSIADDHYLFMDRCANNNDPRLLYQFASGPKAVKAYDCPNKKKGRQPPKTAPTGPRNIMSDPRVKRGMHAMSLGEKVDELPYYPCFEMVKKDPLCKLYLKELSLLSEREECIRDMDSKLSGKKPQPKKKRQSKKRISEDGIPLGLNKSNAESQTDLLWEYLADDPETLDKWMQSEPVADADYALLGRAKIHNVKTGDDVETQIEPGDLFYFDIEVEPILESVISTVIEQSLLEIMMESELDALLRQQRAFEYRRNQELARLQRLQRRQQEIVEERARQAEKEREDMRKSRTAGEIIGMGMYAKCLLGDILSAAAEEATRDGAIEPADKLQLPFKEWMESEIKQKHLTGSVGRALLDHIILEVVAKRVPPSDDWNDDRPPQESVAPEPEAEDEDVEMPQTTTSPMDVEDNDEEDVDV